MDTANSEFLCEFRAIEVDMNVLLSGPSGVHESTWESPPRQRDDQEFTRAGRPKKKQKVQKPSGSHFAPLSPIRVAASFTDADDQVHDEVSQNADRNTDDASDNESKSTHITSDEEFDEDVLPIRSPVGGDGQSSEGETEPGVVHESKSTTTTLDTSLNVRSSRTSNESIAELIAHTCDCGSDCSGQFSRFDIKPLRDATEDIIRGPLKEASAEHARRIVAECLEKHPISGYLIFKPKLYGKPVCESICRLAHGIPPTNWRRGRAAAKKLLPSVPKKKSAKKKKTVRSKEEKRTEGSERSEQTKVWMKDYIDMHGCMQPDSELVYIDDLALDDMAAQCAKEVEQVCTPLGNRQFRRLWNKVFAQWCRKRARKPFGTCTVCAGYKAKLCKFARDPNELTRLKAEFMEHLGMQKNERGVYYKHRFKGLRGLALSIIIDGMDQSKLTVPHYKLIPKDTSNFLETKITGVLVHGKVFNCYVSEPQVKHDSNLNLTCLHDTIMALLEQEGELPRTLYLQVDGGSENKNQWMLSYLSLLVEVGLFDKIKMSFLPVGHTHEDIDQAFSRISVYLNKHDCLTYDEFLQGVHKSFVKDNKHPNVVTIGQAFDFKTWLKDRQNPVESWTDNHCYRFAKNVATGVVEMHYKYLSQNERYFGYNQDYQVSSFKRLEADSRLNSEAAEKHKGIPMPVGVPSGTPGVASSLNFGFVTQETNGNANEPRWMQCNMFAYAFGARCSLPNQLW